MITYSKYGKYPSDTFRYNGEASFFGMRIGPDSSKSIYGAKDDRIIIKVSGHDAWSGHGGRSYRYPTLYLVQEDLLVASITYNREGQSQAKKLATYFLNGMDIPTFSFKSE